MKHCATRHICWLILGTSLILTFVFGCSTLPPAMEAQDFKSIVGKWEGWAQIGTGDKIFTKLTVLPDGSWQMVLSRSYYNSGNTFYGTAMLTEGKFRFDTNFPGLSGNCSLHFWQDTHWLVYFSDDGRFKADLKHKFF
jgi:hypothetical protein